MKQEDVSEELYVHIDAKHPACITAMEDVEKKHGEFDNKKMGDAGREALVQDIVREGEKYLKSIGVKAISKDFHKALLQRLEKVHKSKILDFGTVDACLHMMQHHGKL